MMEKLKTLGLVGPPCGVPNIGLDYGQNIVMTHSLHPDLEIYSTHVTARRHQILYE